MSEFAVTIEQIEKTWPIEGADMIELAKVTRFAYQFVVRKGSFKPNDLVVFIPIESVIPPAVIEKLGMTGKFSGKNCDRVKTKKFKGQISEGFATSIESLIDFMPIYSPAYSMAQLSVGLDITALLGIVKFEPPVIEDKSGNLLPLPPGVAHYDIESCDRNLDIVNLLLDRPVRILEKLEGQNASIQYKTDGTVYVSQRNFTIEELPDKEHAFWKLCRNNGYLETAKNLCEIYGEDVLIRFEYLGPAIQKNIYKLNAPVARVFDIMVGRRYLNGYEFLSQCANFQLITAPVLASDVILKDWLTRRTMQEASNGESMLFKTKREGIVITPMIEEYNQKIGRLFLKQRSPEYKATSELE